MNEETTAVVRDEAPLMLTNQQSSHRFEETVQGSSAGRVIATKGTAASSGGQETRQGRFALLAEESLCTKLVQCSGGPHDDPTRRCRARRGTRCSAWTPGSS
jgi:hypothetical protein